PILCFFFFSSRRRHTRFSRDWSSDVCSSDLALVATGRADVMLDPVLSPWDAAALVPIIEEAGGVFTDLDGRRTHLGGHGVATNAALAQAVRDVLGANAYERA